MKRTLMLFSACLLVLLTLAAGSAPAQRGDSCSWGASSVVVEQVDGQYVQSAPETSGCIPSP
jgi:hypothetical protein